MPAMRRIIRPFMPPPPPPPNKPEPESCRIICRISVYCLISALTSATVTPEPVPTETATPEPTPTETPVPNASPLAVAGEDQTFTDTDATGAEPATLDGSGSADPEGSALGFSWTVDGSEIATGVTATVALPVGRTTVLLTVTDDQDLTATDEVAVTVEAGPPVDEQPDEGDEE